MPRLPRPALALLSVVVGVVTASDCTCDCETHCTQVIVEQHAKIARLEAEIRALRLELGAWAAAPGRRTWGWGAITCDTAYVVIDSDLDAEDLRGCRAVNNVVIMANDVTSLASLESVESATSITIQGSGKWDEDTLESLDGLSGLTHVETLSIKDNSNLGSLSGLPNLTSVGRLEVARNGNLTSLWGLENLQSVGYLWVASNDGLTSLSGLNLQRIGGLEILLNSNLTSFLGLQSLQTVEGDFVASSNGLTSFTGLESLRTVRGLTVKQNQQLTELTGLQSLETVAGSFQVQSNGQLRSLAGLDSLRTVGSLTVEFNGVTSFAGLGLQTIGTDFTVLSQSLSSFAGLESLETVGGAFRVELTKVSSFTGLENLRTVGASLTVRFNDNLQSFTGLENLQSVGGSFTVELNKNLQDFRGLESLQTTGSLSAKQNFGLLSLGGLEGLHTSSGGVSLEGNTALNNISGFRSLRTLGANGDLNVTESNLMTLKGLEGLRTIGGHLEIAGNNALNSLEALRSVQVAGSIRIARNPLLHWLGGLESLERIDRDLDIPGRLSTVTSFGLKNLRSVGGSVSITSQYLLGEVDFESLQTVGSMLIDGNSALANLNLNLRSLEIVEGDFRIVGNANLQSLAGLESLQRVRGNLEVVGNIGLTSLYPGFQSLTFVKLRMTVKDNALVSLQGLGALRSCLELFLDESKMHVLGGPLTAAPDITFVEFGAWPECTTSHEHEVFSAAGDERSLPPPPDPSLCLWNVIAENLTCTKGLPCVLDLASFSFGDGGEVLRSVFISGPRTGCGSCPENHLRQDVLTDSTVNFGYALMDEELGLHSVCVCGSPSDEHKVRVGPVGQIVLGGPWESRDPQECVRGHKCTVRLGGVLLKPTDHVMLMTSACSEGNPTFGIGASWVKEGEYLLHDSARWLTAQPTLYNLCWRAQCTSVADGPACPSEDRSFHVGSVILAGTLPNDQVVVFGQNLTVANSGFNVTAAGIMRLRRTCGKANEAGLDILEARTTAEEMLFHFGRLEEGRVQAGLYHLCWCQESSAQNVACTDERDFAAESGKVWVQCPRGQQSASSGRCEACPAGTEKLDPGLDPCLSCLPGRFSPGGGEDCDRCPGDTFAGLSGSSSCQPCPGWQSSNDDSTECVPNPQMLVLLGAFPLCVGVLCVVLARSVRRRLSVVDVSLHQGCTFVTTLGSHGFSNFTRSSFPVVFHGTGHPGLDSPLQPFRAKVKDAVRLELVSWDGHSVSKPLDTSMGTLTVPFPFDLLHQGRPVPLVVNVLAVFVTVVALGVVVITADMAAEAFIGAAAVALVSTAASAAVRLCPRATPLMRRISEFKQGRRPVSCEKGHMRAIEVGRLLELLEFFQTYIQARSAYYLTSNILVPLTKDAQLSYAEFVGPGKVEWFVSHFWGTAFNHFCQAVQKHAEASAEGGEWTRIRYWVCFCSNNQHKIGEELGAGWQESSFYVTLKSGHCRGTCMVLDDKALPLTRTWCIFELLQTVKLKNSMERFQGLLLCTSGGVLNAGGGSAEVAMALADRVAGMDLATAQATSERDQKMIREQVIREMGTFSALNRFICREVHDMLGLAQRNANQHFSALLTHLEEAMAEPRHTSV